MATKLLGLTNSYCLHGMKFVLFSEQHWPNYLGGCSIVYRYKELQSFGNTFTLIFIRTLAERKWRRHVVVSLSPGENGREHLEVFHKCTFFWSSPMIIIYPGYLPHLLTNFFSWRHCWRKSSEAGNHWTSWSPTRELDSREFLS